MTKNIFRRHIKASVSMPRLPLFFTDTQKYSPTTRDCSSATPQHKASSQLRKMMHTPGEPERKIRRCKGPIHERTTCWDKIYAYGKRPERPGDQNTTIKIQACEGCALFRSRRRGERVIGGVRPLCSCVRLNVSYFLILRLIWGSQG